MKGIVVYRSWWGSCERIAEAIGQGLAESGHEVQVVPIGEAGRPEPTLDFVVVGAATRWPGAWPKIKHYARKLTGKGFKGKPFATFSTGGTVNTEKQNRQASEVLHEMLVAGGLAPLAPPFMAAIEGRAARLGREEGRSARQ